MMKRLLLLVLLWPSSAWAYYCTIPASGVTVNGSYRNPSVTTRNNTGWTVAWDNTACATGGHVQTAFRVVFGLDSCDNYYADSGAIVSAATSYTFTGGGQGNNVLHDGVPHCIRLRNEWDGDANSPNWNSDATNPWTVVMVPSYAGEMPARNGSVAAAVGSYDPAVALPATQSAETFYVSQQPAGNDSNTCTQAKDPSTAKLTICGASGAVSCINSAGDTVSVGDGTYLETCNITSSFPSGNRQGTFTQPITIKSKNANGALWKNVPNNPAIIFNNTRSYWSIEDFKIAEVTGGTGCAGVHGSWACVNSGNNLRFKGLLSDSTQDPTSSYIFTVNGTTTRDLLIESNTFLFDALDWIDLSASGWNTTIRNNIFDAQNVAFANNGHHIVQAHGSADTNFLFEGNLVQNVSIPSGGDGTMMLYGGSEGTVIRNNVWRHITGASAVAIQIERSGGEQIVNNTFDDLAEGIHFGKHAADVDIRNNIFSRCSVAGVRIGSGMTALALSGHKLEYNLFCGNTADVTSSTTLQKTHFLANSDDSTNCYAASCTTGSCQPRFADNASQPTGDYSIDPNSEAYDTGDPSLPTASCDSSPTRNDKGAIPFGCTQGAIPLYVSSATANSTPKFSWSFTSRRALRTALMPYQWYPAVGAGALSYTQHDRYVQFDCGATAALFNSRGWTPLFDSANSASSTQSWTLDPNNALPSGTCCARVQTADNIRTGVTIAWSPPVCFTVP